MKSITLIIPCFNEQEAIPVFYREVKKVLAGMNYSCEILFVNDGSKDNTLAVIKMLAEGFHTRRGRRRAYLHRDSVNHKLRGRRAA